MNFPSIHGIVVTDEHNNICDAEGVIVSRYADEPTRKLDLRVLRNYIDEMKDSKSIFVVGYNTWKNMGGGLRGIIGESSAVISYEDHCKFTGESVSYENDTTLFNYAMEVALRRKTSNIVVLGGRSVYLSFYRNYKSVVHCKVKVGDDMKGKKVKVCPPSHFPENEKYLLNTPNAPCFRPIDNETYSVTIYSLGE